MRVVFADNLLIESKPGGYNFDLQPHLGLISLIAVAEQNGHEARLYDPKLEISRGQLKIDRDLYQNMALQISALSPDVVGFTALGCNFICTLKVAFYLKALNPDLPILLGGPHATILDMQILRSYPQFDVVVRGESEPVLLPLLAALPGRDFRAVVGITHRESGDVVKNPDAPAVADLDTLPIPAYSHYPIHELGLDFLRIDAGRGCPFHCTFCSTATFFGRKFRVKSAHRLRVELDELHSRYGISHFALTHDLFTVNRGKIVEFCEAIGGCGYTWTCSARMDCVDEDLLERMAAAGCRSIYYGVETGSTRMQKIAEKNLDLQLFEPTLRKTTELSVAATASFITGYPQEEIADQHATLDLIGSCFRHFPEKVTVQLHLLTPEPGTKLMAEYGGALEYDGHVSDFNFPTLQEDDGDIIAANRQVFMNHHFFPSVIPRRQHIVVTALHPLLYKLGFAVLNHILWFYDFKYSRLIIDMCSWIELKSPLHLPNEDTVVQYFAYKWGPKHYLTSIVRYLFTAARLEATAGARSPQTSSEAKNLQQQFSVTCGVVLLRQIHNCAELLKCIWGPTSDGGGIILCNLEKECGDYVLVYDHNCQGQVRNFALSEGVALALEYFAMPHTYGEFVEEFWSNVAGYTDSGPQEVLEELIAAGLLSARNSVIAGHFTATQDSVHKLPSESTETGVLQS